MAGFCEYGDGTSEFHKIRGISASRATAGFSTNPLHTGTTTEVTWLQTVCTHDPVTVSDVSSYHALTYH